MQITSCIRKPRNWIFMTSQEKAKWQEKTNKELANDHSIEDFINFVKSKKGGDTK